MGNITKILHSALSVQNIERSIAFYRDVLGLVLVFGPTLPAEGEELSAALRVPGTVLRQAVLRVPETDMMIELLEYGDENRPAYTQPAQNAIGHAHIAFQVENIADMVGRLKEKDVEFFPGPTRIEGGPLNGWTWVYLKDPDGLVLEMVEIDG